MEMKKIKIDDIKPYERNARKNDGAVDAVVKSIQQCEYIAPIILDETNVILAGHTRYKALKKLGYKEIECVVKEGLTEEQKKKYRLLDNKTNELADWDMDLLAEELEGLDFGDLDLDWGLPEITEEVIEDEAPEVDEEAEPIAKLGDIWQLGRHRLMCGSSTDKDSILKLTENNPIYLIYTDPPYGMNAVSKSSVLSENYKTDIMGDDDNSVAISAFMLAREMYRNTNQIWWGANYYTECLPSSECWIVWDKNNGASDQTDCELAWANFRSVVR